MHRKIISKIIPKFIKQSIKERLKQRLDDQYIMALKESVDERAFLMEAGQGKHINGNVFALLIELSENDLFTKYTKYVVITEDIRKQAEKKIKKYDIDNVILVIRESAEYMRKLATAKYLVTDNSFPVYFIKRKEQVYLNTWHGTPLKCLGRKDIKNAVSLGNVQKNFLSSDYLLFPNTYTRNVMMQDYMINRLFGHNVVLIDYPRNDALFKKRFENELLKKYNPKGKKVYAYMPTWRGVGRTADPGSQIREAEKILKELDCRMNDDEILYVNFHFLIGNNISLKGYKHVKKFPAEYETYDFLAICDCLITDYSSVMFDFAQTGKEVIMFMYDYEEYMHEKGFYFDIRTLPFKQAYTIDEMDIAMHSDFKKYSLDKKFIGNNCGCACEKILSLMCFKNTENTVLENFEKQNDTNLIYIGSISDSINRFIAEKFVKTIRPSEYSRTVIAFESKIKPRTVEFLTENIPDEVDYVYLIGSGLKTTAEKKALNKNDLSGKLEGFFCRETERLFGNMNYQTLEFFMTKRYERMQVVSRAKGNKLFYRIPAVFYGGINRVFVNNCESFNEIIGRYQEVIPFKDEESLYSFFGEHLSRGIVAQIDKWKLSPQNKMMRLNMDISIYEMDADFEVLPEIMIGEDVYSAELSIRNESRNNGIYNKKCRISILISEDDIINWGDYSKVCLKVRSNGHLINVEILTPKWRKLSPHKIIKLPNHECVCTFREKDKFFLIGTRALNVTDAQSARFKLFLAYVLHIITFWHKSLVLYEKECSRYEESASIVYEKLLDGGYRNVFFILDKEYAFKDSIPEKYKNHVINRFSFRHYYEMFAAKTIISSEFISHLLEINSISNTYIKHIYNGMKNYVFLQHGVMYMVSLDSEKRNFFRNIKVTGKKRVVTSSHLEAKHFTDYTKYTDENMYITGLAKFDTSYQYDDADKIALMITWRPWERTRNCEKISESGYYHLIRKIADNIPDELKEKLIILPHPILMEQVKNIADSRNDDVWKYFPDDLKYDEILRNVKLLITDYSSVSYDAFYRGSNIIFYWEEKDESIAHYGPNARLMLTEELAFGDVCYDERSFREAVVRNYYKEQSEEYVQNYQKIVEFHDNKNAERIIECMKKDELI